MNNSSEIDREAKIRLYFDKEEAIISLLKKYGDDGLTIYEISKKIGKSIHLVRKLIADLIKNGRIKSKEVSGIFFYKAE